MGRKTKLSNLLKCEIRIGGDTLEEVTFMKYLGLHLDQHLEFKEHTNWVGKKCNMKLGALRKICKDIDQGTSLLLYKSLILSHFGYCNTTYCCATKDALNQLQLLQNSVCKMILLADKDTHI